MRIIYSWCQELDEVITIDSARRYFLSEEPPRTQYHFFCADPHCAEPAVRISGVNYKAAALDTVKQKAAHFREWDKHDHRCVWVQQDQSEDNPIGESADAIKQRHLSRKLSDFINVFDPRLGNDKPPGMRPNPPAPPALPPPDDKAKRTRNGGDEPREGGMTRTSSLERLVATYVEARETLPKNEFYAIEITIVNAGRIRLADYFCQLRRTTLATRNRVIYGGANVKRYGAGFSFSFFDKVDKARVSLYVPKETMLAYRFHKYLDLMLAQADEVRYFTVYALGHLEPGTKPGTLNLTIENLNQLVIRLGPANEGTVVPMQER